MSSLQGLLVGNLSSVLHLYMHVSCSAVGMKYVYVHMHTSLILYNDSKCTHNGTSSTVMNLHCMLRYSVINGAYLSSS